MKKLILTYKDVTLTTRRDIFYSLVKAVCGQQVSTKSSDAIFNRLKIRCKGKINPKVIEQMNIPHDKLNSIKNGADWINLKGEVVKNKDMTYPNSPPNTYAFCTDTRYTESIIPKIKGVDLLYHEATFKNDMLERAFETGHSTTQQASYIANKSCVKYLMIPIQKIKFTTHRCSSSSFSSSSPFFFSFSFYGPHTGNLHHHISTICPE